MITRGTSRGNSFQTNLRLSAVCQTFGLIRTGFVFWSSKKEIPAYTKMSCFEIFDLHKHSFLDCRCILAQTFSIGLLLLPCLVSSNATTTSFELDTGRFGESSAAQPGSS